MIAYTYHPGSGFQKKAFSSIKFIITFGFIVMILISMIACKDNFEQYKKQQYIDTLGLMLFDMEKMLVLDPALANKRINEIKRWDSIIKDTSRVIYESLAVEFKGMAEVYKYYVENEFLNRTMLQTLKNDLRKLDSQGKENTIERDEFKKRYFELKMRIQVHRSNVDAFAGPALDIESKYERLCSKFCYR